MATGAADVLGAGVLRRGPRITVRHDCQHHPLSDIGRDWLLRSHGRLLGHPSWRRGRVVRSVRRLATNRHRGRQRTRFRSRYTHDAERLKQAA